MMRVTHNLVPEQRPLTAADGSQVDNQKVLSNRVRSDINMGSVDLSTGQLLTTTIGWTCMVQTVVGIGWPHAEC
jgi:hypothetical protein